MSPIKPLLDVTGPEKVVLAILNSHMQVRVNLSACRQPGAVRFTGLVPLRVMYHVVICYASPAARIKKAPLGAFIYY
jgi:hypothetical protein